MAVATALALGALGARASTEPGPPDRFRQSGEGAGVAASTRDGVFTASQAKRGESMYYQECAMCHGVSLGGGDGSPAPPLAGQVFLDTWGGRTVGELLTRLRDTMPLDSPGRLGASAYAEITAFIFQANEFPAGERELGSDAGALATIRIQQIRPSK